jgi:tetratricopeptide (TPR) repeat protein
VTKSKGFFGICGIAIGLVVGFFAANSLNRDASLTEAARSNSNSTAVASEVTGPAVDDLLQKAESEPQNFATQMRTGDMYAKISRFDEAVKFYKRGLILKPADFNANLVLANALFDSGKFEEAESYYSKALAINDKDVNARIDLGTTFVERASPDYNRAIAEFDKALVIEPNNDAAMYYLGIAKLRKGDRTGALEMADRLEKTNAGSTLIAKLRNNIDPPQ